MEFITDNFIWFIVGGVILIMALIGYIAEKTNFGRKDESKKEKKVKEEPKNEVVAKPDVEPIVPTPVVADADNMIFGQDVNTNQSSDVPNSETAVTPVEEDLNAPLDPSANNDNAEPIAETTEDLNVPLESVANNGINEDLNAPLVEENVEAPVTEDLNAPLVSEDTSDSVVEPVENVQEQDVNNEPVTDVFGQGPVSVDEVVAEEPVNEASAVADVDNKQNNDINLPNLDTLKDNNPDEEDVWKF